MSKFNYDEFMHLANVQFIHYNEHLRYGQFLMNFLYEKHPEIEIPQGYDCFYDNDLVPKFLIHIHSLSQGESTT